MMNNAVPVVNELTQSFEQTEGIAFANYTRWAQSARAKQIQPKGDWSIWLILAGRGWGKTRTGAEDIVAYAMTNPNVRCGVVAPTNGDLRRVCFEGPSGLIKVIPRECLSEDNGFNKSSMEIKLWNGSLIQGYAAIEPDRLRGPQFHRVWADELASWRYPESFDQILFGLRLGDDPKLIITTTPRPSPLIINLVKRANKDVHLTRGSTFENHKNLAKSALEQLKEKYEGTKLGRQELYADILDEAEGALWNYNNLEKNRIDIEKLPDMERVVVAVDPAVTNNEESDETGIIVAGRGVDKRFYIIKDSTIKASPDKWMRVAIDDFYINNADRIVAEVNNGGDLVEKLLRTIDRNISYKAVRATRGKIIRAEPIAALYEQDKVSHVGIFKELEEQLCSYIGGGKSPDRLDALVWALTELNISSGQAYWRIN